jgi:hypothetical protein
MQARPLTLAALALVTTACAEVSSVPPTAPPPPAIALATRAAPAQLRPASAPASATAPAPATAPNTEAVCYLQGRPQHQ